MLQHATPCDKIKKNACFGRWDHNIAQYIQTMSERTLIPWMNWLIQYLKLPSTQNADTLLISKGHLYSHLKSTSRRRWHIYLKRKAI